MKYLFLSIVLIAVSCSSPKKDDKKPVIEEKKEVPVTPKEEVPVEKPKVITYKELLVVTKNSENFENGQKLFSENGLILDTLLINNESTKVGIIKVPSDKSDYWLDNLKKSGLFNSVDANSEKRFKEIKAELNRFISYRKTACYGHCPVYNIRIDKTGKVFYNGIKYVRVKGKREFQLTEKEFATLKKKLNRTNFKGYKRSYNNPNLTDLASTYINYNGKEIQLRVWKNVPDELAIVSEYIEDLLVARKLYEL